MQVFVPYRAVKCLLVCLLCLALLVFVGGLELVGAGLGLSLSWVWMMAGVGELELAWLTIGELELCLLHGWCSWSGDC